VAESIQTKLARVRRPKSTGLIYGTETDGCLVKAELPFIVGVISDFSGDPTGGVRSRRERKFTQIDINTFDDVIKKVNAGLNLCVPNTLLDDGSEMAVHLKIESLDDFSPVRVAAQIEPLRKLLESRQQLKEVIDKIDRSDDCLENLLRTVQTDAEAPESQATATASSSNRLLDQATAASKQTDCGLADGMIHTLVAEANQGQGLFDERTIQSVNQMIASIDQVVSKQLAAVLHHARFQKLEGTWRGLHYLCKNSETNDMLKIKILNCSKLELAKDLLSVSRIDQSNIWRLIYDEAFLVPGGQPYGALVGDFEFENHRYDIKLLEDLSGIAAGAFAPFITAPSAKLLGLDSWQELPKLVDLRKTFEANEYTSWKKFRDSEDSRFVVMTLPRTLARLPYGSNTQVVEQFNFEELPLDQLGESVAVSRDNYCWMNTAYVYAARLTAAFAETNWCTAIRGRCSGGAVEGLPSYAFRSDKGDTEMACPTEVPVTERREKELSDLGFLTLCHFKNTDYSVFFGGQTTHQPKKYDSAAATENAAISARLPYIMASSRIAHYLKVMVRDYVGGFIQPSDVELWLNRWIQQYVCSCHDSALHEKVKAKFPLADAAITVTEIPGSPGAYNAIVLLRPWLTLEELQAPVRMVVRLDKPYNQ